MSPILVRPVREQLEHDRVIRLLQAKYKKKLDVVINPGNEQAAAVGDPASPWYPDLVLYNSDKSHKLAGVVEVESAESVNHLEAMSQWKVFSSLNVPFHLYLPTGSIDTARRFCADMAIPVAELWAYQAVGDQIRFAVVHRTTPPEAKPAKPSAAAPVAAEGRPRAAARPAAARSASAPARPAATPRAASASRPASGARPARAANAARARGNGDAARRPAARRAAAAPARTAAKPKAAAARRPVVKVVARKTKAASSSRAHKRR